MDKQYARFNTFIKSRNREDEREAGERLLKVAAVCDEILENGKASPEQMQVMVDGASDPRSLVWENTVDMFWLLSKGGVDIADALLKMSKSTKANVRFAALCCLTVSISPAIADEMILAGLVDKSTKVLRKAADMAGRLKRRVLAPAISAALDRETTLDNRNALAFVLSGLRDSGYTLERQKDGSYSLRVSTNKGYVYSQKLSEAEATPENIAAIVASES